MITGICALTPPPKLAIIGEPSSMRVLDAHKGTMTFLTEVTGVEAHSSDPAQGVNAISYAAKLVGQLEEQAKALRSAVEPSGRFVPPYTTLNVGLIAGGTVKNIVPGRCSVTWELRPLPGADISHVLQNVKEASATLEREMKTVSPGARIDTRLINVVPALQPAPDGQGQRFVSALAAISEVSAAAFASEAGHYQAVGIAALICGPGSIEQAHRPDEYIEIAELQRCADFMRRLGAACERELPL